MCLAAVIGPKGTMSFDECKEAWNRNPHGAGFAYIQNNEIYYYKTQKSVEEFYEHFKGALVKRDPDTDMLVHFRWATHGSKALHNVHPFFIDDGKVAIVHNGVIARCKP